MNTTRMAILGIALACGIGCVGVLAHGLSAAKPKPAPIVVLPPPPPANPTVHVLVSRRDLKLGDRVQTGDLTWRDWPVSTLSPSYITDTTNPVASDGGQIGGAAGKVFDATRTAMSNPADGQGGQFVGAVVREHILPNEPIVSSKLVLAGGSGVLAVTLDPGMRAVALPLTPESAAGGFIQPGDHVDVLMTRSADGGVQQMGTNNPMHGFVATTVMRNVKVLAIDQNMGAQKTTSTVGATATVEVSPRQAEYLVLAKASGTIALALRSYADAAGGPQVGSVEGRGQAMAVRVYRDGVETPVTVTQ